MCFCTINKSLIVIAESFDTSAATLYESLKVYEPKMLFWIINKSLIVIAPSPSVSPYTTTSYNSFPIAILSPVDTLPVVLLFKFLSTIDTLWPLSVNFFLTLLISWPNVTPDT